MSVEEWGVRVYWDWGVERREFGILSWVGGRRRVGGELACVIDEEWLEGYWYDVSGVVWESEEGGRVVSWSPSLVSVDLRVTYWEEIMLKRYDRCVELYGMVREERVESELLGEEELSMGVVYEEGEFEMFVWVMRWFFWSVLLYVLYVLVSAVFY